MFDVGIMLVAGLIAYVLEDNGFPIAPAILGVVLGGMLEENFMTSMIKSDGNVIGILQPADRGDAGRDHVRDLAFAPLANEAAHLTRRAVRPPRTACRPMRR